MPENESTGSFKRFFTPILFFVAGIMSFILYQNLMKGNTLIKFLGDNGNNQEILEPTASPTPTDVVWIPYPTATPTTAPSYTSTSTNINSSTKFTIVESKKISADKTTAETGETVSYNITLRNSGSKKKFLSHICFNHSGGVTFGCLLNKNLEAGEEFNVNNYMRYTTAGTYSVWVTWSQDGTNFYRPQGAGTATVTIY